MKFNENKIMGYGHSQGSYILHLANKLAPNLFIYIIDNSAWIDRVNLYSNRYLRQGGGNVIFSIEFDYMAKSYLKVNNALSLHKLYTAFKNGAYIYSLLGTTHNFVDVQDKRNVYFKIKVY